MMISDALTLAAIFASGGLLGYIIGAARGRKLGRDEQWVDCFLGLRVGLRQLDRAVW
jgi:hypothetical protein